MYPSTLMTPSSSSHHRSFLGSPFLNSTPRCITKNSTSTTRRRFRVSVPCNSLTSAADQPSTSSEELSNSTTSATDRVFGSKKELKGIEVLVDKLSPPVRLASSAIIIAGAVAAGYGLGTRFGGSRNAALGGAVALGAVGRGYYLCLDCLCSTSCRSEFNNHVAGVDDPAAVKKEGIEGIAKKYGVRKQDEAFISELSEVYCQFVSFVLPPGSQELKGDEVAKIINFRNALGIDDSDAAPMHVEFAVQ
ncbi:TIC110 protein, chloroplastic [Quillaja saponaria]|uniref:TIC110 protein, chloroplastic n=1 Tax=Quillaja saponaria TaxID=32244 RepID=A0AAD7LKN3_QUISA|nr:TIC110 protein, chloroplastic [Quillaja saponaria]